MVAGVVGVAVGVEVYVVFLTCFSKVRSSNIGDGNIIPKI